MGPAVRRRPARMAPMLVALRFRYARCSSNRKETMAVMKRRAASIVIITVLLQGGCLFAQSEIGGATPKRGAALPPNAGVAGAKITARRKGRRVAEKKHAAKASASMLRVGAG